MKWNYYRWSDHDRRFGPFIYAHDKHIPLGINVCSGDEDERRPVLRMHLLGHTLIVALPQIIKPHRVWHEITHEPMRSQIIAQGKVPGYWDIHQREFGFRIFENAVHFHYGPQTFDSSTTKSKCWFFPWTEHKRVRHSVYDTNGEFFATIPEWGFRHKHGYTVREAILAVAPVAKFAFKDFDGEEIIATCMIEEREWQRGKGIFRLLFLGRNKISRSLDLRFSSEVGKRKGSWKGGTIGHGIEMLPNETPEAAFRRYCAGNDLTFVGDAPDVSHAAPLQQPGA